MGKFFNNQFPNDRLFLNQFLLILREPDGGKGSKFKTLALPTRKKLGIKNNIDVSDLARTT